MAKAKMKKNFGKTPLVQGQTFDRHIVKKGDVLWTDRRGANGEYEIAQAKIEEISNGYACYFSWADGTVLPRDKSALKRNPKWLPWNDVWSFFKWKKFALAYFIYSHKKGIESHKKDLRKIENEKQKLKNAIKIDRKTIKKYEEEFNKLP